MLNEEQIEDILYQYVKRQDEFNMSVISVIADRLSRIADFDNLNTLDKAVIMQEDISKMNKLYNDYIKDQKKRIRDDFWWISIIIYLESLKFYEQQLELEMNKELMSVINEMTEKTQKLLGDILKYPVFVIRDLKNLHQYFSFSNILQ